MKKTIKKQPVQPWLSLKKEKRLKKLLVMWANRETTWLAYKEIVEKAKEIGIAPRSTDTYLKNLVEISLLEKRRVGYKQTFYRPKEYLTMGSEAIPQYLLETSHSTMVVPLHPYVWVTLHNFPPLEELLPTERGIMNEALQNIRVGLAKLNGIRWAIGDRRSFEKLSKARYPSEKKIKEEYRRMDRMWKRNKRAFLKKVSEDHDKFFDKLAKEEEKDEWCNKYEVSPILVTCYGFTDILKTFQLRGKKTPFNIIHYIAEVQRFYTQQLEAIWKELGVSIEKINYELENFFSAEKILSRSTKVAKELLADFIKEDISEINNRIEELQLWKKKLGVNGKKAIESFVEYYFSRGIVPPRMRRYSICRIPADERFLKGLCERALKLGTKACRKLVDGTIKIVGEEKEKLERTLEKVEVASEREVVEHVQGVPFGDDTKIRNILLKNILEDRLLYVDKEQKEELTKLQKNIEKIPQKEKELIWMNLIEYGH